MAIVDEEVNVGIDPGLVPLETDESLQLIPPAVTPVTGTIRSIDGMAGPDVTFNTGAAVNGIAIAKSSVGNVTTFSITGPGTMAQRNAIAAVADESTADAADLATAIALVNALKAKLNDLLGKARTAGHLTP